MSGTLLRLRDADLLVGGALLGVVALFVTVGPMLWHADPMNGALSAVMRPPDGAAHPLGTDQLGRDLLARLLLGTRISLMIVLAAGLVSSVLGTAAGLLAGWHGGWVDAVVMRAVEIQLAIPFILLILLIVALLGPGIENLVLVLGITGWAVHARVARARTLEVRELEYVEAARAVGMPPLRIVARHVLPNIAAAQIVLLTLDLPRLVVAEASVGFLGLGVQPPVPTLGNLIGDGRSYMLLADWLVIWPGVVIAALVLGFNLVGDWLVRRADVRVE